MKWMMVILGSLIALGCGREVRTYPTVEFPAAVEVATLDEALTFARIQNGEAFQVLAVAACDGESVTAFNLTESLGAQYDDPIELFNDHGYEALRDRINEGLAYSVVKVPVAELVMPLELTDAHIAAGTNFAAHAEESEVEDGPFLFAKMVTPTPFDASVSAGDALLDYEVELAFVTLSDTPLPEVPEFMGLILSNDFTNRAALLRNVNVDDVTSGDGFTTGKSAPGYLPVGNLFVIPRELRPFVDKLNLKLAVNGSLRQEANMTLAIWDIDELFRQIQARETTVWTHLGEDVRLPIESGAVPARTLILAGTPEGTVFNGIPRGAMVGGVGRWIAGGWGQSVTEHVIESYIETEQEAKEFLQPGDEVVIHVEKMGVIRTTVEE